MRSVVQLYPGPPLYKGAVAQLGERLVCNQEATGSIPVSSTRLSGAGFKEDGAMEIVSRLGVWIIPVAAIVVWGVIEMTKMILAHQERIAKIERGINPDSNPNQ